MCPYALWEYNEDGTTANVTCEPKNEKCTFCVAGNAKTYIEIVGEKDPELATIYTLANNGEIQKLTQKLINYKPYLNFTKSLKMKSK